MGVWRGVGKTGEGGLGVGLELHTAAAGKGEWMKHVLSERGSIYS